MSMLGWIMVALALWHFTIFLPDHFLGGIVGAFVGALIGGVVSGVLLSGIDIPGRAATDIGTVMLAIPGALIGMAIVYFEGDRREKLDPEMIALRADQQRAG